MKKKMILAALLMSMAVTVYAEEVVWEEQTATEDVTYAETDRIRRAGICV